MIVAAALAYAIDAYVTPYVSSNNFSGIVLVEQHRRVLYERPFGLADREAQIPNTLDTRFHVASMSMQFTAAAILRLEELGKLQLDETVGKIVPNLGAASNVTVRELLEEQSGLADINDLPSYAAILQQHQTPAALVAQISSKPTLFAPGTGYHHEEHSAYNVLALIIETETHETFATAMTQLVFAPMGLTDAGVDDDGTTASPTMAKGYQPQGVSALAPAMPIHWSAKAGNGSVYETARDEAAWVQALFDGAALPVPQAEAMLDLQQRVGYGWFKSTSVRFGEAAYYMNGRAPGYSSFVLHLPREDLTVVALGNIYSSATTTMGNDIAAIALGRPYIAFHPAQVPPNPAALQASIGTFQFGTDFYQPNARLVLKAADDVLSLTWPSGDVSFLIPLGGDRFIDRSYWVEVQIARGTDQRPTALSYGSFRGTAL
jgi:CubicO group peptidase (beta-lactamase class C family)